MDYVKLLKGVKVNKAEEIGNILNHEAPKYGVITDNSACLFVANCMLESGKFTTFVENMNYGVEGLKANFGRAFNPAKFSTAKFDPNKYARNPQAIANLVYDDRIFPKMGLGNNSDGDGWKYRGHGAIQVTGKAMWEKVSKLTGIDFLNDMSKADTIEGALIASLAYWKINGLDKCSTVECTRKIINSGHGVAEVTAFYNQLKAVK